MDLRTWWQRGLCAALVLGLYGSPLGLSGWLGHVGVSTDIGDPGGSTVSRAPVWYEPPTAVLASDAAPVGPIEPTPAEPTPAEPTPSEPEAVEPAEDLVDPDPSEDAVADGSEPDLEGIQSDLAAVNSAAKVRARRVRRAVRRPRPEPTKKQQRQKRRWERKKARRAKQKQCIELTEHILPITDDETWLTRELVDCYLAHPEQSYRMGSTWWATDAKGKHVGFGVRVSRRHPIATETGMQSGDIVLSVNGFKLRTWSGVAFAAPNLLRGKLKVKLVRGDEKRVHTFRIKDRRAIDEARSALALAKREQERQGHEGRQDTHRQ